jgi:hypothetical protein
MNNWGFNFVAPVALAIWAAAVAILYLNPEMAADWMREFRIPPTTALRDRLALVLLAGVLAFLCSIPFLAVGRLIGFFVARRLLSEPPPEAAASEFGQRQFLSQFPTPVGREQTRSAATVLRSNRAVGAYGVARHSAPAQPPHPASGGFRFIARAFFGLLWAAVFFVGGALVMGAVVTAGITDLQLRNQASRHAGATWGVWLFFGSIALAILLGSLGLLPGTRLKKRQA